jgi:DNA-binding transcriptional ArsR family regulator
MDRDLVDGLKALADITRIRIIATVGTRPGTEAEIAERLGLSQRAIDRHLRLLVAAGLLVVNEHDRRYRLAARRVAELGRGLAGLERSAGRAHDEPDFPGVDPEDARVLRAFVGDGRLSSIPAQDRKRRVVLRWLLEQCFAEDRDYPEKEVNQRLALYHPDVASLRRYLVDGGLMRRESGIYRRAGAGEAR